MNGTPSYENMSLEEFIKLPYVVQIYAKDGPIFENKIKDIPFVKLERIIRGDYAIAYFDSRRIHDFLDLIGNAALEMLPESLTTLGRASLKAVTSGT